MAVLNTFIDRIVEHPGRYTLTDPGGAELGTYDLSRDEGTVTEEGTPLNAANLNPVVNEINGINDRLDAFLKLQTYTKQTSINDPIAPGDNTYYINFSSVPKGYDPVYVVGVNTSGTGSSMVRLRGWFLSSNGTQAGVKMRSESQTDLTAMTVAVTVLYVRSGGI